MSNELLCYNQIILRNDLSIPDDRPKIKKILRTTCAPSVLKTITKNQFTVILGELTVNMEYVADVPDCTEPVYFISFKTHFADSITQKSPVVEGNGLSVAVEYEEFAAEQRTVSQFIILRTGPAEGK